MTLRGFTLNDADDVTRLVSDYEVAKTTLAVPHPYPTDGAAGWIAGHPAEEQRNHTTFAITLTATGELIGAITLIEKRIHLRAEIGYWVGYQHWGNGYATEATKAIIDWGFSERAGRLVSWLVELTFRFYIIHFSLLVLARAAGVSVSGWAGYAALLAGVLLATWALGQIGEQRREAYRVVFRRVADTLRRGLGALLPRPRP